MGVGISLFNDLAKGSPPLYISGPDHVVNEAAKPEYGLSRELRGKSTDSLMRVGLPIKEKLMFDEDNTATYYLPASKFTWRNPQVVVEMQAWFRYLLDYKQWTEQEVIHQGFSSPGLTARQRTDIFINIVKLKEQRCWTSILNKIEASRWLAPDASLMEGQDLMIPYSYPVFINEGTNGRFGAAPFQGTGSTFSPAVAGGVWTAIENITYTAQPKWKCQQLFYDSSTVNAAGNIVSTFDRMFRKVRFVPPANYAQYFDNVSLYSQVISASNAGISTYENLLRAGQNLFVWQGRQDPAYPNPTYRGIELEYEPELDSALLYQNDDQSGLVGELAAGSGATRAEDLGPRYYWRNTEYCHPIFHPDKYFEQDEPMRHPNAPKTWVQTVDCWTQTLCWSLQRQGIVSPKGDIYTS